MSELKERIEKALSVRGVYGDRLLDALDIVDDVLRLGGDVSEDGYAKLYHATNSENKAKILSEMAMYGKEDGIFFSTKKDGQILGYGNSIIRVSVPVEELILDDEFSEELHYKIKVKPYQKIKLNIEL